MARPTFPNIPPKFSPSNKEVVRESSVSFGDGYELFSGDGLNMVRAEKSQEWGPLTYAQVAEMINFIRSRSGDWFYYTLDENPSRPRKFKCREWEYGKVPDTHDFWYFNATFKEIFTNEV